MKSQNNKRILSNVVVVVIVLVIFLFLNKRGTTDIIIDDSIEKITITSTAFDDEGAIPDKYTGKGEDISPSLQLSGLSDKAVSIAIIMDDLDIPWNANFTHWVIWNIPIQNTIPEAIPSGKSVSSLGGAVQGVAYGQNEYRGPNPPFGTHRYEYHVFVLDCMVELDNTAGKSELMVEIEDHILQYGSIIGWYPEAPN